MEATHRISSQDDKSKSKKATGNAIPSLKLTAPLQRCYFETKMKNAEVEGKTDCVKADYTISIDDLTQKNLQSIINVIPLLENNLSSFALQLNRYVSYCNTHLQKNIVC
jgi:hypothetical protein